MRERQNVCVSVHVCVSERDTADSHTNLITESSGREMAVFEWCFIAVETASGCMSPWRLRAQACFSAADDPVE